MSGKTETDASDQLAESLSLFFDDQRPATIGMQARNLHAMMRMMDMVTTLYDRQAGRYLPEVNEEASKAISALGSALVAFGKEAGTEDGDEA